MARMGVRCLWQIVSPRNAFIKNRKPVPPHRRAIEEHRENAMIELLERQKRLTANQWKLICTANVADLLDFFDFFLIGYVTAALTKEWSLPYWQGGAILLALPARRP